MHINDLTFEMIYEVIHPLKDCMGDEFNVGELLTFKGLGWSPHDGWHFLKFAERSMALDPHADQQIVEGIEQYLRPVAMATTIVPMTLADFKPGTEFEVTDTFVDSNRTFFSTGERLKYLDQSFDAAEDLHSIRFEGKLMKLWRGHDVSLHSERFFRIIK